MKKVALLVALLLASMIHAVGELGQAANETLDRAPLIEEVRP